MVDTDLGAKFICKLADGIFLLYISSGDVYIGEPNIEDTITILRWIKDKYELHHGLHIKDSPIISAGRQ